MKLASLSKGYAALNAGAWVGEIPFPLFEGVKLKVRRLWNPDHADLNEKLTQQALGELPSGAMALSDEATRLIELECLARTCLEDWSGIDETYTPELGIQLMSDPAAGRSARSAILWAAGQLSDQVKAQLQADEKN